MICSKCKRDVLGGDGHEGCAAPDVTVPPGWRLVPEEPTPTMMDAGLYQSSHDSEWADVWQAYVDMVRAAPQPPHLQKPTS